MRFIDRFGSLKRSRRAVSKPVALAEGDDLKKLAEAIRQLSVRIQELEAKSSGEAVEFELNVSDGGGAGQDYLLEHNIGGPYRWYLTDYAGGVAPPHIIRMSTSTDTVLVLRSFVIARIVVRIEPSQHGYTGS